MPTLWSTNFCMHIAALVKFNVLKRKNQASENALTEKQQVNGAILLEHQNEKQRALTKEQCHHCMSAIKGKIALQQTYI